MHEKTAVLIARIKRLREATNALPARTESSASTKKLLRRLRTAAVGLEKSYDAACIAGWGDSFLLHISAAARHAKRVRQILQDLMHLNYSDSAFTRELMFEARGVENILTASKNTLSRRRAARRAASSHSESA